MAGAEDIIAEMVSDHPDYRKDMKKTILETGTIKSKGLEEEDSVYRMYYDYREPIKSIANHRILAINRGEKDKKLKISIEIDEGRLLELLNIKILKRNSTTGEIIKRAVEDAWKRLFFPSLEREIDRKSVV